MVVDKIKVREYRNENNLTEIKFLKLNLNYKVTKYAIMLVVCLVRYIC